LRSKRQFSLITDIRLRISQVDLSNFIQELHAAGGGQPNRGPELSEGNQAQIGVLLVILEPGRGNNIPDIVQDFFVVIMG
jgi:hypothetical protein